MIRRLGLLVLSLLLIASPLFAEVSVKAPSEDGLIVVLRKQEGRMTAAAVSDRAASFAGSAGVHVSKVASATARETGYMILKVETDGRDSGEVMKSLRSRPEVLSVTPNRPVRLAVVPNDPEYPNQWGLQAIGAEAAWSVTTGDEDVVVAVLDSGIDYNHPDLAPHIRRDSQGNLGRNTISSPEENYSPLDVMDDSENGHGTHVAGIIGAVGNNGTGVSGVAWNVGILNVKVMNWWGFGWNLDVIMGLDYVLEEINKGMNVRVVNMSICGWYDQIPGQEDPYLPVMRALVDKGVVIVAAAGNDSQDTNNPGGLGSSPVWPDADFTGLLPYPAALGAEGLEGIVSVAALTQEGDLAYYSNYSTGGTDGVYHVDFAAPGDSIYSTMPLSMGGYGYHSGTSMAAPMTAGVFALLASRYPEKSATELIDLAASSLEPYPLLQGKLRYPAVIHVGNALGGSEPDPGTHGEAKFLSFGVRGQLETKIDEVRNEVKVFMIDSQQESFTFNFTVPEGCKVYHEQSEVRSGELTVLGGIGSSFTLTLVNGDDSADWTVLILDGASAPQPVGGGGGGGCSAGTAHWLVLLPLLFLSQRRD